MALVLNVDTDRMFIHQLAAQQARHGDQASGDQRYGQSPGQNRTGVVKAQQPVQRRQREHYDRYDGMTPTGNQAANTRHGDQVDNPRRTGNQKRGFRDEA